MLLPPSTQGEGGVGLLTCLWHRLLGFYNSRVVFETIVFNDPIEALLWRQTVAADPAIPRALSLPALGTHLSLSLPGSLKGSHW